MYESFYGLTGKPFQLNPDPAFFYRSRGHGRAMAYLDYGVHQAEGFIVVTGDVGAGKTTLVRNLLRSLAPGNLVAKQIVSTQLDADDMLRMVAGAFFGVQPELPDKAGLLLGLERYFRRLQLEGKRALLIVDEAQNLTPRAVEELRMLSNFQTNERSLLQSFLLGQPEFRQIMQQPEMRQLRQRVIASYHLGPLGPEETKAYIEHRLGLVGWQNDPSFDDAAFAAIHEAAGGIPRQINVLCDRILLAAFLGEKHNLEESDVADVAEELRTELRGGLTDEEAEAASQGFASSAVGTMPAYMPTLSMVNGKATFGTSRLSRDANAVLLNGLAEQVHLLQQSVASVARTLDQLRASEQTSAQPEVQAEEPPEKRPAQVGGMES
ncbi:MAG: XrtA/PEP-CTERM system-associated ATPase [Burkholderiaceae bacterium]